MSTDKRTVFGSRKSPPHRRLRPERTAKAGISVINVFRLSACNDVHDLTGNIDLFEDSLSFECRCHLRIGFAADIASAASAVFDTVIVERSLPQIWTKAISTVSSTVFASSYSGHGARDANGFSPMLSPQAPRKGEVQTGMSMPDKHVKLIRGQRTVIVNIVKKRHHGGNCGIELHILDIKRNLLDRLMERALKLGGHSAARYDLGSPATRSRKRLHPRIAEGDHGADFSKSPMNIS